MTTAILVTLAIVILTLIIWGLYQIIVEPKRENACFTVGYEWSYIGMVLPEPGVYKRAHDKALKAIQDRNTKALLNKAWSLNHATERVVCTHGTHQYSVDLMSTCMEQADVVRVRMDMSVGTYDEQVYEDECVLKDMREYRHTCYNNTYSHGAGHDSMQRRAKRMAMRDARWEALSMRDMDGGNYMVTTEDDLIY